MVIVGSCLLAVAALAFFNIVCRAAPLIRCYREGIECNLISASRLDSVRLLPGEIRLAWLILSLQGFRSHRVRIAWSEFAGASVSGHPMAYVLTLNGAGRNLKTGRTVERVSFKQAALNDMPQRVAESLSFFAIYPFQRAELPTWQTTIGS